MVRTRFRVLANDREPDGGDMRITRFTDPAHGRVTCERIICMYRPDRSSARTDSFLYTVADDQGATRTATVVIRDPNPPGRWAVEHAAGGYCGGSCFSLTIEAALRGVRIEPQPRSDVATSSH